MAGVKSNMYGGGRLLLRYEVTEQPWWQSARCRALWLELALHARWDDRGQLHRGETIAYQNGLAGNLGICKRTVMRGLAELAGHGEISQRQRGPSGRHGTVIALKSYDRFCRPGMAEGPALYIDRAGLADIAGWSDPETRCVLVALAMHCHHGTTPHVVTYKGKDVEVACGYWFGPLEVLARHAAVSVGACEKILRKLSRANVIRFCRMPVKIWRHVGLQNYGTFQQLADISVTDGVTDPVTRDVTDPVTVPVTQYKGDKGDKGDNEDRLRVEEYEEGEVDLSDHVDCDCPWCRGEIPRWMRDEPFWGRLPAEQRYEWVYAWQERVACLEYEEHMPRLEAEKAAYQRVHAEWQRRREAS
jgi:hypothetical protein